MKARNIKFSIFQFTTFSLIGFPVLCLSSTATHLKETSGQQFYLFPGQNIFQTMILRPVRDLNFKNGPHFFLLIFVGPNVEEAHLALELQRENDMSGPAG